MIRLPLEGEVFGRYRLGKKLGQGGMGVVYAARDTALGRDVALKLVAPQHASDEDFRARFGREAAILARVESPRIVRIYDYGEQDGVLFLVTQLIEGGDLARLVSNIGRLSPVQAVSVVVQVLEALIDAHAVSIVHRDIKPGNVLLRGDGPELEAFLCDFGIATTPGADLSRTGTLTGSLPYMAPERHQGIEPGPVGDIYSAGCLLWFALTGAPPYAGTDVETAVGHLQAPVRQLPGKDKFSSAMNSILRTAMAKDPRKRYANAAAMVADLREAGALAPGAVALQGATSLRQEVALGAAHRRRWVPALIAAAATGAILVSTLLVGGALGDRERGAAHEPGISLPSGVAEESDNTEPRPLAPTEDVGDGGDVRARDRGTVPATDPAGDGGAVQSPPVRTDPSSGGGSESSPPTRTTPRTTPSATPRTTPSATLPPPPTTPKPPPVTCWNGKGATSKSACPKPTGKAGALWIFHGVKTAKLTCRASNVKGAKEAWRCTYGKGSIVMARWGTVKAAKNYATRVITINRTASEWNVDGSRWGSNYNGRHKTNGTVRYRYVRVYNALPWSVLMDAPTTSLRTTLKNKVDPYRRPGNLRGVTN